MRLRPASGLWLLAHELRLMRRSYTGSRQWVLIVGGGLLWLGLHVAAWVFLQRASLGTIGPIGALAGVLFWLMLSIIVSQTMAHSVAVFYDRGDLDLLLASPLPPRTILAIRTLGIALGACTLPGFLLFPFAHVGLLSGRPWLLAVYPAVFASALAATAVGMGLTIVIVRAMGARRARVSAQILAAIIGAAFFLGSQAHALLPKEWRQRVVEILRRETQPEGLFGPDSALWWPVRALQGEPGPLLATVLGGLAAFWLVVSFSHRRFASGAAETVTGGGTRKVGADMGAPTRFRSGVSRTLLRKEWTLLRRDPQIISQTLLQLLYMVPLLVLGLRSERASWLIIPGLVIIASMLAGHLAWLTVAAEDSPELLGTAPLTIERARRIKAAAAVIPVLLLVVPLVLWWLVHDPYPAFVLALTVTGSTLSAALCQIWNPRQGKRSDLKQRYRQNMFVGFLESTGAFGWAAVAVCMDGRWLFLPLALVLVVVGPGSAWLLGRPARARGALA